MKKKQRKRHLVKELSSAFSPELDLVEFGVAPILQGKADEGYRYVFDTIIRPVQAEVMEGLFLQKMEEYANKFYREPLINATPDHKELTLKNRMEA